MALQVHSFRIRVEAESRGVLVAPMYFAESLCSSGLATATDTNDVLFVVFDVKKVQVLDIVRRLVEQLYLEESCRVGNAALAVGSKLQMSG